MNGPGAAMPGPTEERARERVPLEGELADHEGRRSTATAERPASAGGTLVADLERLVALRRSGDLTADQFERTKSRLLQDRQQGEAR
jgi:hypothetical protein